MSNKISVDQTFLAYQAPRSKAGNSAASSSAESTVSGDTLTVSSSSTAPGLYTKEAKIKVDTATVDKLKQEARTATENLRAYVVKLLQSQGKEQTQPPSEEVVSEARNAISDDGDWGVKAVSDRIVAFAQAISGNDRTKLDSLKEAIEKGFEAAGLELGNSLPAITKQTHDEIMKKLDAWGSESQKDDSLS